MQENNSLQRQEASALPHAPLCQTVQILSKTLSRMLLVNSSTNVCYSYKLVLIFHFQSTQIMHEFYPGYQRLTMNFSWVNETKINTNQFLFYMYTNIGCSNSSSIWRLPSQLITYANLLCKAK